MDQSAFFSVVTFFVSLILLAIGIYLIFLIHEAHQNLKRINRILKRVDDFTSFLENSIARPAQGFGAVASLIHDGSSLLRDLKQFLKKQEKEADYE